MDERLSEPAEIGEEIACAVARISQNNGDRTCIFENPVGELCGADLEPFRKLEGDRGVSPAADPAFDVIDLEIEQHQWMSSCPFSTSM
nr:hypothetical protein [Candidatus Methanomethylophilus sp. 1R26]